QKMRRFNILLFFLIVTQIHSQSLNGYIRDSINRYERFFNLKLKNADHRAEYFSQTNRDGQYECTNLTEGNYVLNILDRDYLNNQFNIKINGDTNANFYVLKYCKYNENKNGSCPVCESKQNAVPIFYGLTTLKFEKKNRKK